MYIKSVTLNNFRAYKGNNTTTFNINGKNIFLIAGDNGFGKTTFLTSLVWCLYGKMMVDVDDKFRRDINDVQGYKNYARLNLNKELSSYISEQDIDSITIKRILKEGYGNEYANLEANAQYSVSIHLTDVSIPSIPCKDILVTRTYDFLTDTETTYVLIDNQVNELAKDVGYDIFINDFILSKDIAKFFFFDAEKIVSLAEIRSIDERRKLSTAYSEVLGIKKYEDIKRNLENLRTKFRRRSSDLVDKNRLDEAIIAVEKIQTEIVLVEQDIETNDSRILSLKTIIEDNQEKLIREGNAMSVEELIKQKELRDKLKEKDHELKVKLKDLLDIAPFAISGKLLVKLKTQVDKESAFVADNANNEATRVALKNIQDSILHNLKEVTVNDSQRTLLNQIVADAFSENINSKDSVNSVKVLVDYTKAEKNEFQALYDNIRYSFSQTFKQLVKDEKNNSLFLSKTTKKISQAEYGSDNADINKIRKQKAEAETQLLLLDGNNRSLLEKNGILKKELATKSKILSELKKRANIDNKDKAKDELAERLIEELNTFLFKLKLKKKVSLERRIKSEIDKLMHKDDFIDKVKIELKDDIIDILLQAKDGTVINKDRLSKGEQQLYATSILKALVDESEIEFPVFIDSPLQKFDSRHARNIIDKFYPTVSKQVVIFPLLGKELSEEEYNALLPNVNSAYIIRNRDNRSSFEMIDPREMFKK
jgi:DNA sulfur modification protein DndD